MMLPQAANASLPSQITLTSGGVVGTDNLFMPNDGDTSTGGLGQTIHGITCAPTMITNKYHVHLFVGLLVNGAEYAINDGLGMDQPGADVNGFTNSAHCFYSIHTHDATGMLHVEANSSASLASSIYTLGDALDVWGEKISSTGFGPYKGTVTVFTSRVPLRTLYSGTYTKYTADPRTIPLYSHETIWIEVGTVVTTLPRLRYYTEY